MLKVILTPDECQVAIYIAKQRFKADINRTEMKADGKKSPLQIGIEGMSGELAVGKGLNIYPDMTVVRGDARFPKYDMWWNGRKLQVKATDKSDGNIVIPKHQPIDDELRYILVRLQDWPTCYIIGWIDGDEAKRVAEFVDWDDDYHKPFWIVYVKDLVKVGRA